MNINVTSDTELEYYVVVAFSGAAAVAAVAKQEGVCICDTVQGGTSTHNMTSTLPSFPPRLSFFFAFIFLFCCLSHTYDTTRTCYCIEY